MMRAVSTKSFAAAGAMLITASAAFACPNAPGIGERAATGAAADCLELVQKTAGSDKSSAPKGYSVHDALNWVERELKARNAKPQPAVKPANLSDMIGQMIVVGLPGRSVRDAGVKAVLKQLRAGEIGGVLLTRGNIRSPRQLKNLTAALKAAAKTYVPLIQVDQEGGRVQRLDRRNGHRLAALPSAINMARSTPPNEAFKQYKRAAGVLADAGINVNLGPVVDLNINPRNPDIARWGRSYGKSADLVTLYATVFVRAHEEQGVLTVAKHFPGQGTMSVDPHKALPDVSESWSSHELSPFQRLINAPNPVPMIMVGHVYHRGLSGGAKLPASLSPGVVTKLLRERLRFEGVVMTDDLEMSGASRGFEFHERIVRAVNAGNDILLFANLRGARDHGTRIHDVIKSAVEDGRIERTRIEDAYRRIAAMKLRFLAKRKVDGQGRVPKTDVDRTATK